MDDTYTISKEITYWKNEIDSLEKIKKSITIKSQIYDNTFKIKMKKITEKIDYLSKKNKLFKKSLYDIELKEKFLIFINNFLDIVNNIKTLNINLFYLLPENLISNIITYANINLLKKLNSIKIFEFCLKHISNKEIYPNLHTRCNFAKYCVRYSSTLFQLVM